jgi:SpoVK/Ycf46/Vps4 family AAA+-type ATPase
MKTNILKRNVRPKKAAVKHNGKSISKARAASLNNIIAGFKRRKIISSANSINRSVMLLFTGGGNDNKIMAAEYIADMLGKKVYRVGLSEVVSKYIGETAKNLNRIFKKAAGKNWILFFDEADALFGKRTKVKDSHDKYANMEVSYLLERMENFSGLVILSSNKKSSIDPAFIRRINGILVFPLKK